MTQRSSRLDLRTAPPEYLIRFWSPLARMAYFSGFLQLPFDRIAACLADPYSRALPGAMLAADRREDLAQVSAAAGAALAADYARRQELTLAAVRALAARGGAAEFRRLTGTPDAAPAPDDNTPPEDDPPPPDLSLDQDVDAFATDLARCCDLARDKGVLAIEQTGERSDVPLVRYAFMLLSYGMDEAEDLAAVDRYAVTQVAALAVNIRMIGEYAEGIRFRAPPHQTHFRIASLTTRDVEYGGIADWNAEWGRDD